MGSGTSWAPGAKSDSAGKSWRKHALHHAYEADVLAGQARLLARHAQDFAERSIAACKSAEEVSWEA